LNLFACKLLADENIHPLVIQFLLPLGCEVVDVYALGLAGQPDDAILRQAMRDTRIVLTHDRDFGRLAILGRQLLHGIVFLRPGHIDPQFTIASLEAINKHDFDLSPSFILVARRRGPHVQIRVRRW
jgi:predicted nuclease of predicted toxin-antitoxin system